MVMGAPTRTNTAIPPMPTDVPADLRLLTLTQWLSPSFPIGAFAYSHGVEQAIHAGWVHDAKSLQRWLADLLTDGSAKCDVIWCRLAHDCADDTAVLSLDDQMRAFAGSAERVREAERQGQAFVRLANEVWDLSLPQLQFPVALGQAARQLDLPIDTVSTVYLQTFLGNLISAAQRLMPLGQSAAQLILADLNSACADTAARTKAATLADISSTAFLSDISAMRHETLQPRIFQT